MGGGLRGSGDALPLLPLGRRAEHSEAMRGFHPLTQRLMEPLIRPSATFSPKGRRERGGSLRRLQQGGIKT
jgi:hypothetical protein